jgi:hypothetical protein
MKKILFTMILLFSLLFIAGCSQTVEEVKKDENVGKVVSVKGEVKNTIKLGDLSGYTLVDENGDEIGVVSNSLPAEGETITAKGTLVKAPLLGYYIDVDK